MAELGSTIGRRPWLASPITAGGDAGSNNGDDGDRDAGSNGNDGDVGSNGDVGAGNGGSGSDCIGAGKIVQKKIF